MAQTKDEMIDAALMHVPFDGWSETTFRAAAADADIALPEAQALFPRGAVDLALAFHARGDAALAEALAGTDMMALRIRDRITLAVRKRLEIVEDHKEAVRRGMTLFSLPVHAADGSRALWQTADAIWTAAGDTSDDLNWYTKRVTLSGVYASTVLYWLGDQSAGHAETWAFLDRRIEDVMRFEKVKADLRGNRFLKPLMAGPEWLAGQVRKPGTGAAAGLPGRWRR